MRIFVVLIVSTVHMSCLAANFLVWFVVIEFILLFGLVGYCMLLILYLMFVCVVFSSVGFSFWF